MFIPSRDQKKDYPPTPENNFWDALVKRDYDAANAILAEHPKLDVEHRRLGKTIFQSAIEWRDLKLAQYLLDHGADVDAVNKDTTQPLIMSPLLMAAGTGDSSFDLVKFLIDRGANVNTTGRGRETPLHRATQLTAPRIMQLLIDHGANLDARNDMQQTPLLLAATKCLAQPVEILLRAGADETLTEPWSGRTALQCAAAATGHWNRPVILEIFKKHMDTPTPAKAKRIAEAAARTAAPLKKIKSIGFSKKGSKP